MFHTAEFMPSIFDSHYSHVHGLLFRSFKKKYADAVRWHTFGTPHLRQRHCLNRGLRVDSNETLSRRSSIHPYV